MKRIAFVFSIVAMALVMGFVQRTPSAAMANCSKNLISNGWLTAGNALENITTLNVTAGETLSLTLDNSNPAEPVWFKIGSQSLTQTGSGTLTTTFAQATNNVSVQGGGGAIYEPNHYWMIWYELDSLTPCRPVYTVHP